MSWFLKRKKEIESKISDLPKIVVVKDFKDYAFTNINKNEITKYFVKDMILYFITNDNKIRKEILNILQDK